jgi:hypothetical protein
MQAAPKPDAWVYPEAVIPPEAVVVSRENPMAYYLEDFVTGT